MRIILLLLIALSLFSCKKVRGVWHLPNMPVGEFPKTVKTSTPDFRQGWDDGCQVGVSAGGNWFYKSLYKTNAIDGYKMTSSPDYKSAWGTAFWFCYRYTYIKNKSSIWGSIMGGLR